MIGRVGPMELFVVVLVVLLLFGPSQIPKLGRVFGETIRSFRGIKRELEGFEVADDPTETRDADRERVRRG